MLKVKANEKLQKIGKYEGTYRYIMMPELYTTLAACDSVCVPPVWPT